jgi:Tfp pilus assembly protein PilF
MDDAELEPQKARMLFEEAYKLQMRGELGEAIVKYRQSLAHHESAEAYTFLGWTYSMLSRYEEAIAMCRKAIAVDPGFGNPYNDIGAYLIALERWAEAVPWLEKATKAPRYQARHFAFTNLGRVYEKLGRYRTAKWAYELALKEDPFYLPATWASWALLGRLN